MREVKTTKIETTYIGNCQKCNAEQQSGDPLNVDILCNDCLLQECKANIEHLKAVLETVTNKCNIFFDVEVHDPFIDHLKKVHEGTIEIRLIKIRHNGRIYEIEARQDFDFPPWMEFKMEE
jgi:hypothetical protein